MQAASYGGKFKLPALWRDGEFILSPGTKQCCAGGTSTERGIGHCIPSVLTETTGLCEPWACLHCGELSSWAGLRNGDA